MNSRAAACVRVLSDAGGGRVAAFIYETHVPDAERHKQQLYAQKRLFLVNWTKMLLLRTFAPCLLMAFLAHHVSLSSGARGTGRTGQEQGADRAVTLAPSRALRSGRRGSPAGTRNGKFSTKDKMQCAWDARVVGDTVRMSVKCEDSEARVKGAVAELNCDYSGKPQGCPGYWSDPRGFWNQVSRALKKLQGKMCKDDRALIKAGMCKRAPRDAHFKLEPRSSVSRAQTGHAGAPPQPPPPPPRPAATARPAAPTTCTGRANHRQKAEEVCSSAWASVCSFFFSMLQSEDC